MSGQDRQNSNEHNEGAFGCMSIGWATLGLAPKTVLSRLCSQARLDSCATNSPTVSGQPSSQCCRISRAAYLGSTTVVSSMASSGSCDPEHQDSNHSCYIDHSADDDVLIFTLISHRRPLS